MEENGAGGTLFPDHVCVLAREDNPERCGSVGEADPGRCGRCKSAMQGLMWEALYSGDRSLVAFLLPPHMRQMEVVADFYEDRGRRLPFDPVLVLETRLKSPSGSAELFIVPRDHGGFTVFDDGGEDEDFVQREFAGIQDAYEFFHACHIARATVGGDAVCQEPA